MTFVLGQGILSNYTRNAVRIDENSIYSEKKSLVRFEPKNLHISTKVLPILARNYFYLDEIYKPLLSDKRSWLVREYILFIKTGNHYYYYFIFVYFIFI